VSYLYLDDSLDPRVTVTNALGKQTVYHFAVLNGARKVTTVEGLASANCASANRSYEYYPNGTLKASVDWNGARTEYLRDARGLETQRIEAKGTSAERTITTVWHADFAAPTKITEPGRVTEIGYQNGRVSSRREYRIP
jgi:uncharacterized protein RhaS with RHS repeats